MWQDLIRSVALMLIIEGILPFLHPRMMRDVMQRLRDMDDRSMRVSGLLSMIIGLGVLYAVK